MHALLFYCWESLPWCLPPATFAVERAAPTYDLSKYGHDITVPVVQDRFAIIIDQWQCKWETLALRILIDHQGT